VAATLPLDFWAQLGQKEINPCTLPLELVNIPPADQGMIVEKN